MDTVVVHLKAQLNEKVHGQTVAHGDRIVNEHMLKGKIVMVLDIFSIMKVWF